MVLYKLTDKNRDLIMSILTIKRMKNVYSSLRYSLLKVWTLLSYKITRTQILTCTTMTKTCRCVKSIKTCEITYNGIEYSFFCRPIFA